MIARLYGFSWQIGRSGNVVLIVPSGTVGLDGAECVAPLQGTLVFNTSLLFDTWPLAAVVIRETVRSRDFNHSQSVVGRSGSQGGLPGRVDVWVLTFTEQRKRTNV